MSKGRLLFWDTIEETCWVRYHEIPCNKHSGGEFSENIEFGAAYVCFIEYFGLINSNRDLDKLGEKHETKTANIFPEVKWKLGDV